MRSGRYLQSLKAFLAAAFFTAAAVVVLDAQAYAQRGKGHGKNGGGPPGHQKQMGRQQWGGQMPGGGGNPQRQMQWGGGNKGRAQQPQIRVANVPAQQNRSVQWANRGQELMKAQRQQARQQQQQYRQVQRQQQQQYRQVQRQQQIKAWGARQQMMMQQQGLRRQQGRKDQASRQQYMRQYRSAERQQARQQRQTQWYQRPEESVRARRKQQVYASPVQIAPGFTWTGRQWGQANAAANRYRRDQKHAWKAERKEQRRFEKEQRRYARDRDRSYDYNNYGNYGSTFYGNDYSFYGNDYSYDRPSWKQQLLRTVIVGFLGGGGERYGSYDRYDTRDFTRGYERPVYYSEDVPRYYNSPIYVGYSPDYADGPEYYYSDYDYQGNDGFDLGGIIGQLPIQELLTSFAGDGFVSELFGGLLVQGYDEGFLAGQAAREYGYDDTYYDNPYVFEGGFCDPYSVSVGDNRELLGEGYAIGYRDALNGRDDYDPYSDGNVDLVSALLSGVLGRV